jgi:hypothetical protein
VQTVTRKSAKVGKTYQFTVRLQNDAQRAGPVSLSRSVAGVSGINVRYSVGGVDVTSSVVAGTFSVQLEPWSAKMVDVSMTPTSKGAAGASHKVTLRAVSLDDATRVDVARLVLVF